MPLSPACGTSKPGLRLVEGALAGPGIYLNELGFFSSAGTDGRPTRATVAVAHAHHAPSTTEEKRAAPNAIAEQRRDANPTIPSDEKILPPRIFRFALGGAAWLCAVEPCRPRGSPAPFSPPASRHAGYENPAARLD